MRSRGLLSVCLVAAQTLIGQTRVSLKTQGKEVDFSQATWVRPFQTGTTLPASCVEGEMFFKTDASAGANLYGCVAGSWVQQAGGNGNGSPVLSVFGRTGHVAAQTGDYSFSQILGLVSNAQISAGVDAAKIGAGTVDNAEFGYLDGVTSPIQAQLNSKASTSHSHTVSGDATGDLGSLSVTRIRGRNVSTTAPSDGQALVWDAAASEWRPATVSSGGSVTSVFGRTGAVTAQTGDYSFSQISGTVQDSQIAAGVSAAKVGSGSVDNTEFGYLDGVTSPIQTQLNSKASTSHSHALAGDVTGDVGSTSVERIRGRPVSSAAPSGGQVLAWNATLGQWEPASVSGGGSGSGTANTPLEVTRSTATQLAIGSNCSASAPCIARFGAVTYTYTAAATATVTSGGGTAYLYVSSDGSRVVGIPSSGMSVSCTGCNVVPGVTAFPVDSLPLYSWSASTGQWSTSGTDYRSILSAGRRFVGGAGISIAESGSTVTISATGSGGGAGSGGYTTVQDEGSGLPQQATLNFTGGGVTCTDDSAGGRTTCSIPNNAGGDLTGTLQAATVSKLQGRAVAPTAPSNGQVLTWNAGSSQWEPQTPSGGGAGFDVLDPAIMWFKEEFWGGVTENNGFAAFNRGGGTCNIVTDVPPEANHFGIRRISLSGTISAGHECVYFASTAAAGSGGGQFGVGLNSLSPGQSWHGRWIVRVTTADTAAWVGFVWLDGTPFSMPGNPGIVVRYDPRGTTCSTGSDSTTNWVLQTYTSSTARTCVDTGVPFSANTWYNIEIFSTSSGIIQARVNGSTPVSSNTNVPWHVVTFGAGVLATSTSTPSFHQDFWGFKYVGASR